MTTDFMNFNGDSLDKYLGHEMIEIDEESAKSKLVITNQKFINILPLNLLLFTLA